MDLSAERWYREISSTVPFGKRLLMFPGEKKEKVVDKEFFNPNNVF